MTLFKQFLISLNVRMRSFIEITFFTWKKNENYFISPNKYNVIIMNEMNVFTYLLASQWVRIR